MPHSHTPSSGNRHASLKTIVVVSHDMVTVFPLLERLVAEAAYQLILVSDCLTLLKFLRSSTPHLVFIESGLLSVHGIDLSERLRVMKDLQAIPFLIYTEVVAPSERKTDTA